MAKLNISFLVHLFMTIIIIDEIQCKPVTIQDTAGDTREPQLRAMEIASPIFHAGFATANGRFGKNIRAFTVNEFQKYIVGLM